MTMTGRSPTGVAHTDRQTGGSRQHTSRLPSARRYRSSRADGRAPCLWQRSAQ